MAEENKAKIRIFSTKYCPYCSTLKAYLKSRNFEFEDIDVSENQSAIQEMIAKSGQMGVPVAEINGQIVVGFNKTKITELLNIKE